jgi:hypothetical protein
MGLRLQLLYWWTPNFVIKRELGNLSDRTIDALQRLLTTYTFLTPNNQSLASKDVKIQRIAMAQTHAQMVEALAAAVGHDKAVALGREALFAVGVELGKQTQSKLGVGNNSNDLLKASKILYRILGIDFHIEWIDQTKAVAVIEHCALSEKYSKLTCEILSATDEGVIAGLQPNVEMNFQEYITGGCPNCRASLNFKQTEPSK